VGWILNLEAKALGGNHSASRSDLAGVTGTGKPFQPGVNVILKFMLTALAFSGMAWAQGTSEVAVSKWTVKPDTIRDTGFVALQFRHPDYANCGTGMAYMQAVVSSPGVIEADFMSQADSSTDCPGAIRPYGPNIGVVVLAPGTYQIRLDEATCDPKCHAGIPIIVDSLVVLRGATTAAAPRGGVPYPALQTRGNGASPSPVFRHGQERWWSLSGRRHLLP
jgi:hypothetical protein